ncbi:MAG: proton-conducting transporter transmembrane domain-containing protein [Streptosporangiaceae bacterium]
MTLLYAGIALLGLGVLFKIGAVPFHSRKPDLYQGGPTAVTALMASCTLISAYSALLRVLYVAFGQLTWQWRPAMWAIAIVTMLAGSIIAITQTDMKRLLAASSIAQTGYVLSGVVAASVAGLSSSLFYLAAYGISIVAAIAVLPLVGDPGGEARHLSRWAGLGPPFTTGRQGVRLLPDRVRRDPADRRLLREVRGLRGCGQRRRGPAGDQQRDHRVPLRARDRADVFPGTAPRPGSPPRPGLYTRLAVTAGAAVTRWLRIAPQPLLDLANQAANSLFIR